VVAHAIFTYGTLAFPGVMRAVTGRTFASRRAWVCGFARLRVRGVVYPGLLETGGRCTDGRVYLGVDDQSLARLDRFEDWLYERRVVEVVLLGGAARRVDAWVVPPHHASFLLRVPWDADRFVRRYLHRYLRGCRDFRRLDRVQNPACSNDLQETSYGSEDMDPSPEPRSSRSELASARYGEARPSWSTRCNACPRY